MSTLTRAARPDELEGLWPAVASSHTFGSAEAFARFHRDAPWCIRVDARGDAYILRRWRAHSDVVALLGVWAPPRRMSDLVVDARAVAGEHGFRRVMSPLVPARAAGPYLEAGMVEFERLVAYSVATAVVGVGDHTEHEVVIAGRDDVDALAELDRRCFEEFWCHGIAELRDALEEGAHVTLVRDAAGGIAGSAISALSGSVVTIGRLATAPAARRGGVASALLADADRWARSRGAIGLSLCTQVVNEPARRLYERVGFERAPDEYVLLMASAT